METKENWNELVEFYLNNKNVEERKIQDFWEGVCSEFLGYKKTAGEIDSQRSIQIGTRERAIPDIILRKDKKDVVDIELKKYNACFDESMENQLISYLKQLHISVGLIVCEKIYVYSYDYGEDQTQRLVIEFVKDNPKGIEFLDIISKNNFDKTNIKKFIEKNTQEVKDIENIKSALNEDLIKSLLNEYFLKNYSQDEIDNALEKFVIKIKEKTDVKSDPDPLGLDRTKYVFNGQIFGKNRLVQAVVKTYVNQHPNISLTELQMIFYKELQGSIGVVYEIEKAKMRGPDYVNRFFIKNNDVIHLRDANVYVCNQWGISNIDNFLKKARSIGFIIEEVR